MRILCTFDSDIEEDAIWAKNLVENIGLRLQELKKVIDYKGTYNQKLQNLKAEQEECNRKLAALKNAKNIQNLYRSELKLQKERTKLFDFSKRAKIRKELLTIRENKNQIRELKAKTEAELAGIQKAIERRTSLNALKIISSQIVSLTRNLYNSINEYRRFRKEFILDHGISLPTISLNDLIERRNGKEITILSSQLPTILIEYDLDPEIVLDSYEENGKEYIVSEI